MLDWLERLLCKGDEKQEKPELPTIAPGERWLLCPRNGDPWGQKPYRPVTILDVRDGWVRYDMGAGPFRDERKKIDEFVGMYRLVTPNATGQRRRSGPRDPTSLLTQTCAVSSFRCTVWLAGALLRRREYDH